MLHGVDMGVSIDCHVIAMRDRATRQPLDQQLLVEHGALACTAPAAEHGQNAEVRSCNRKGWEAGGMQSNRISTL